MSFVRTASVVAASAVAAVLLAAGGAAASAGAEGTAVGSPGVLSGNLIQVPVHVPVNVCGNSIGVVSLLNPTLGNSCANAG